MHQCQVLGYSHKQGSGKLCESLRVGNDCCRKSTNGLTGGIVHPGVCEATRFLASMAPQQTSQFSEVNEEPLHLEVSLRLSNTLGAASDELCRVSASCCVREGVQPTSEPLQCRHSLLIAKN
jgi:hypothetical protein